MIEVAKALLQSKFYSARVIFLCPYAVYMYKIMILLTFPSEIRLPISTKFCVDSTVDWESVQMVTLLTVMFMYGKIMITKKNTFFFFKTKNSSNDDPFISCNDRIRKKLHNICISAVCCSGYFTQVSEPWSLGLCFFHYLKQDFFVNTNFVVFSNCVYQTVNNSLYRITGQNMIL